MKKLLLFLILAVTQLSAACNPVSETDKLAATCRIWGFLKYYHPQVAEGKFNWDQKLIEVLPLVEKAFTKQELSNVYLKWIDGLGEVPLCKRCAKQSKREIFDKNFNLGWMQDSEMFTEALTARLKYIEANRDLGDKYYVGTNILSNGPAHMRNEPVYKDFQYPGANYRLLSLFRYWNIIEYFYPYKYATDKNWDDVLKDMVPKFRDAKDVMDYHLAMLEIVASINDSHASMASDWSNSYFGYYWVPFRFKIVDNKAVVTSFYDVEKAAKDNIQLGDAITHVNGIAINDILEKQKKYIPTSNPSTLKRDVFYAVFNGISDKVKVTFERGGATTEKEITRYYMRDMKFPAKAVQEKCRVLDGNIGYVHMGTVEPKDVKKVMKKLAGCKAIVFDIRNYPRRTVYKFGKYILPEPRSFVWFTEPDMDYPGKFKWMKSARTGRRNKNYYKGKIIMLVDESTQSQAEFTTMSFQAAENCITIGSQTAGADGDVTSFELPGGFGTAMSGLGVYYPGGSETQRVGIKVDIEVHPTIAGMRAGKDEVLEKALEIANSK